MLALYALTPHGIRYVKDVDSNGKFKLTRKITEAQGFRAAQRDRMSKARERLYRLNMPFGHISHPRDISLVHMLKEHEYYKDIIKAITYVANPQEIGVIPTLSICLGRKSMPGVMLVNSKNLQVARGRIEGEILMDENDGEVYHILFINQINYTEINRWVRKLYR